MSNRSSSISSILTALQRNEENTFGSWEITRNQINQLIVPTGGRRNVWPQPVSVNYLPMLAADDESEGAQYCRQYESRLAALEPDVEDYFSSMLGQSKPRQAGETIRTRRLRYIEAIDKYLPLLLQISVDCASQQMKEPLLIRRSKVTFLDKVDTVIRPWETTMVVDSEEKPLLTVIRHEINREKPYPNMREIDPSLRLEMSCTMYNNSITRYQGLIFDGAMATFRFNRVPNVESIFLDQHTRLDHARYRFPRDRNGFVCHLVNLLKNSDDYERYFKYSRPAFDVEASSYDTSY